MGANVVVYEGCLTDISCPEGPGCTRVGLCP